MTQAQTQAATQNAGAPLLSVVVTVYNGAALLPDAFDQILALEPQLGGARLEVVAVDDGSDDDSYAAILRARQAHPRRIAAVRLSKNYGAMAAAQAGIDHARGDCIAVLPQDLQDEPQAVAQMFAAWRAGSKVNMTTREGRDERLLKRAPAAAYHAFFRAATGPHYPRGGLGVFLIDRQYADILRAHPEKHADILLRVFNLTQAPHLHPARRGEPKIKSKWTLSKNIKLAIDNFIGFSHLPVRFMSLIGALVACGSVFFAGYVFVGKFTGWYPLNQPPGWATIVILIAFLFGLTMLMLGLVGEYLWRIFDIVSQRPVYLVAEKQSAEGE